MEHSTHDGAPSPAFAVRTCSFCPWWRIPRVSSITVLASTFATFATFGLIHTQFSARPAFQRGEWGLHRLDLGATGRKGANWTGGFDWESSEKKTKNKNILYLSSYL